MMHSQPAAPMKSMGHFKSEAEAKAAGWTFFIFASLIAAATFFAVSPSSDILSPTSRRTVSPPAGLISPMSRRWNSLEMNSRDSGFRKVTCS